MAKTQTAKQAFAEAWKGLEVQQVTKLPRTRLTPSDFAVMKQTYIEEYGYTIKIPQFEDIIHLKPTLMMTDQEIKDRKRQQLQQILASPTPEWSRPYTTLMTWIDNIQDHTSLLYPTFKILLRWSPRIFLRAVPYLGWVMLATDLLSYANDFMRAPWKGLRAKRAHCEKNKGDPFSKNAQLERQTRIKKYNASFGDLIQVAQTTDQWTGFGLSLGAVMGFAIDAASGLIRYISGEKVSISPDLPKANVYELMAAKALVAAGGINTAGQVFSEETHFWSMVAFASAVNVLGPYIQETDFLEEIEFPQALLMEVPRSTSNETLTTITDAGLDPEAGRVLPHFLEKQIPMTDWQDWQADQGRKNLLDFYSRHSRDSYGFLASHLMDDAITSIVELFEPDGQLIEEDTPASRVLFSMLKAPLRPTGDITRGQSVAFGNWIDQFTDLYGHTPTLKDIKHKLDAMGVSWTNTFPTTLDDKDKHLWPEPFDDTEFD